MSRKKVLILIVSFVLMLSGSLTSVSVPISQAKPPALGKKLSRGVKQMYYTVNTASVYTSKINDAVHNWMYTGYDNPINMHPVSSTYATDLDFYKESSAFWKGDSSIIGETFMFDSNKKAVNPEKNNWYYAEIRLNSDNSGKSYFTGSIKHEMGHAMGLAHTDDKKSIMCQMKNGRSVQTVQKGDSDKIVDIYGWS